MQLETWETRNKCLSYAQTIVPITILLQHSLKKKRGCTALTLCLFLTWNEIEVYWLNLTVPMALHVGFKKQESMHLIMSALA